MPARRLRDVVVVVPGIMGSTLCRGEDVVWGPSIGAVGRGVFSNLRTLRDLVLPAGIGDDAPDDGIEPGGLIRGVSVSLGIWSFDLGYGGLLDHLRAAFEMQDGTHGPANLVEFAYDWRLSIRHNGERLAIVAKKAIDDWRAQGGPCADAQLVFVCHSMGGLVARWYVDHLGGHVDTRKVITLGTPHRGSLKALDTLANGVRKVPGWMGSTVDDLARSLPSLHQLLPAYRCIEGPDGLVGMDAAGLPGLVPALVADAVRLHEQLEDGRTAAAPHYDLHPIVGYRQSTLTTARVAGPTAVGLLTHHGEDRGGDGTVPRLAATPVDLKPDDPSVVPLAQKHGALAAHRTVRDLVEGVLRADPVIYKGGPGPEVVADVPEVLTSDEPLVVRAATVGDAVPLEVRVTGLTGRPIGPAIRVVPGRDVVMPLPGPGGYRVEVRGAGPRGPLVDAVTSVVTVWPPVPLD